MLLINIDLKSRFSFRLHLCTEEATLAIPARFCEWFHCKCLIDTNLLDRKFSSFSLCHMLNHLGIFDRKYSNSILGWAGKTCVFSLSCHFATTTAISQQLLALFGIDQENDYCCAQYCRIFITF